MVNIPFVPGKYQVKHVLYAGYVVANTHPDTPEVGDVRGLVGGHDDEGRPVAYAYLSLTDAQQVAEERNNGRPV